MNIYDFMEVGNICNARVTSLGRMCNLYMSIREANCTEIDLKF